MLGIASQFANDAIIVISNDGMLLDANLRFLDVYGYFAGDVTSLSIADLRSPTTLATLAADLRRAEECGTLTFETEHRRKDGSVFPVEVSTRSVIHRGVSCKISVIRDITERKAAEAQIARLTRLYESVMAAHRAMLQTTSIDEMLGRICSIATNYGLKRAWIGLVEGDRIRPIKWSGVNCDDLAVSVFAVDSADPQSWGPTATAVRTGASFICNDFANDPITLAWRRQAQALGWGASAAFPLFRRGTAIGALTLCSEEVGYFGGDEIALLDDLASDISIRLELAESEEMYRSLFANMLNGFAYCRMLFEAGQPVDFIYLGVNAAFETQTGLRDVAGRRVSDVIPGIGATDAGLLVVYGRVALGGKPETIETYVEAMARWFNISIYSPQPEHFVAVFEDITSRKSAEERLKRQQEIFRLLTDTIDDVFWLETPAAKRMDFVSPAYQRIWGRSCDTLYQDHRAWAAAIHPDDRDRVDGNLISLGRFASDIQFRIIRPDGDIRWINARTYLVRDGGGRGTQIVGIAADVTRKREIGERLRQSQKMEALGTFAGGIAHDFNNILTGILGFAHLIPGDVAQPEALLEDVSEIRLAVDRAKELVRQILTYSRNIDVAKAPVDLAWLVRAAYPLVRASIPRTIEVLLRIGGNKATVFGASVQLHQVLLNLCANAADAIGDGAGHIAVAVDAHHDDVRLVVTDNGQGIAEDVRDRIFDPFFTTKGSHKGTGLGLSVVKGIVDDMCGRILIEPAEGGGTRFVITLPRYVGDGPPGQNPAPLPVTPAVSALGMEGPLISPPGLRVLVVDDETAIATALARFLRRKGCAVTAASSPREALAKFERGQLFDAVITDQMMAELSGLELAERIHALQPHAVIVLTSGLAAPAAPEILAAAGICAFFAKPVQFDDIFNLIINHKVCSGGNIL